MNNFSFYHYNSQEIAKFLREEGLAPHLRKDLLGYGYRNKPINRDEIKLTKWSQTFFNWDLPKIVRQEISQDGTQKLLLKLSDGQSVETVLLKGHKKYTFCLSSQVGCSMKCSFCYTGMQGLKRHLNSSEIVAQYLIAQKIVQQENPSMPTSDIVFMGQGEALHNFDQVQLALEKLMIPEGLHLGPRQITLSTAGFGPGLKQLHLLPPINLAFSLHSPFQEEREQIMPLAKHMSIDECFFHLYQRPFLKRQYLMIQYTLLQGLNHTKRHALELAKLVKDHPVIINLIPFNPFKEAAYQRPSTQEVEDFRKELVNLRLRVMVRTTRGDDIMAACGQLNTKVDP